MQAVELEVALAQALEVSRNTVVSALEQLASEGRLTEIPGVGKGIASKIDELLSTGRIEEPKRDDVRNAIDQFKRDTVGACPQGSVVTSNPTTPNQPGANNVTADPRSRVVIDDCTIFDSSNLDRYPPDLETLVKGVRVKARTPNLQGGSGLKDGEKQATEINEENEIIKYYLREMPVDPITGKDDTWKLRSSYQSADEESWDSINVFDVRSGAEGEGLNGEKYSDW